MKLQTVSKLPFNLDRKLVTTLLTSVVTYVLVTVLGLGVTDEVKGAIALLAASIVGWIVPPSDVERA